MWRTLGHLPGEGERRHGAWRRQGERSARAAYGIRTAPREIYTKTAQLKAVVLGRDRQPVGASTGLQAGLESLFAASVMRFAA